MWQSWSIEIETRQSGETWTSCTCLWKGGQVLLGVSWRLPIATVCTWQQCFVGACKYDGASLARHLCYSWLSMVRAVQEIEKKYFEAACDARWPDAPGACDRNYGRNCPFGGHLIPCTGTAQSIFNDVSTVIVYVRLARSFWGRRTALHCACIVRLRDFGCLECPSCRHC